MPVVGVEPTRVISTRDFEFLVISCTLRRLLKVVFPEDEGPEMSTSFTRFPFSPRW